MTMFLSLEPATVHVEVVTALRKGDPPWTLSKFLK
jgi:hypothetical protein